MKSLTEKWHELLSSKVELGARRGDVRELSCGVAAQEYEHGAIVRSKFGYRALHGEIYQRWVALGFDRRIGVPTSDVSDCSDGTGSYAHFRVLDGDSQLESSVFWHPLLGAFVVQGQIRERWADAGWEKLGYPTQDGWEPDDPGQASKCIFRAGEGTAANRESAVVAWQGHVSLVDGPIYLKWRGLQMTQTCYPLSDVQACADGEGRSSHFVEVQEPTFSSIYWHPKVGTGYIRGAIRDLWLHLGGESGVLGYPVADERDCDDGIGRCVDFRKPGKPGDDAEASIYWHPSLGAFEVREPIRAKWLACGGEKELGYPSTSQLDCADLIGAFNEFQTVNRPDLGPRVRRTRICHHPSLGTCKISGRVLRRWMDEGAQASRLGYPVADEFLDAASGLKKAVFERGEICVDGDGNSRVNLASN